VPSFRIESWKAIAPGLETSADWQRWLCDPGAIDRQLGKIALPGVPALMRRRFSATGKSAMAAAMPLVEGVTEIPSIFASRHGDTPLTLTLLEGIARCEPMSPTSFSLAVHNAVSGLFSIVRKDTSTVSAIAAAHGLVLQTLFEALGQLQDSDRLLCVIYDAPLPEYYQARRDDPAEPFPWALAMVLGNSEGESFRLEPVAAREMPRDALYFEPMGLLRLLSGFEECAEFEQPRGCWRLSRVRA